VSAATVLSFVSVPAYEAIGQDELESLRGGNPNLPSKCSRTCDTYNNYTCVGMQDGTDCTTCQNASSENQYPSMGQLMGCSVQTKGWTLDNGNTVDCGKQSNNFPTCKNEICTGATFPMVGGTDCKDPTQAKSQ
jgi:hypothetical protein